MICKVTLLKDEPESHAAGTCRAPPHRQAHGDGLPAAPAAAVLRPAPRWPPAGRSSPHFHLVPQQVSWAGRTLCAAHSPLQPVGRQGQEGQRRFEQHIVTETSLHSLAKRWRFELQRALRSQLRVRHKVKVEEMEALPMFSDSTLAPRVRNQVCG